MPSPFPGMDPYIEEPELWQDFHGSLAPEIRDRLSPHLRPRYYAALTPHMTYEALEIGEPRRGRPDVGVLRPVKEAAIAWPASPAAAPQPVESRVPYYLPLRLLSVEIRTAGDKVLVASIEVLSPVNKDRSYAVAVKTTHFAAICGVTLSAAPVYGGSLRSTA